MSQPILLKGQAHRIRFDDRVYYVFYRRAGVEPSLGGILTMFIWFATRLSWQVSGSKAWASEIHEERRWGLGSRRVYVLEFETEEEARACTLEWIADLPPDVLGPPS